jgi:hypothetical protein
MAQHQPIEILRALSEGEVEFILVGGVAAVALGCPINAMDLEVVHKATPENVRRLPGSLVGVDARYLAALGTIGAGHAYADLLPHTVEIEFSPGLHCRVLDLETQIAIKEEIGAEKDLAMLPILRRTLAESRRPK